MPLSFMLSLGVDSPTSPCILAHVLCLLAALAPQNYASLYLGVCFSSVIEVNSGYDRPVAGRLMI
jgi:hypothetical protein